MFDTPVLFLVFKRPDTTTRVFSKIREAQPKQLFIAADGPREGEEGEKEKTEAVRKLVLDNIDWDCDVYLLFRTQNLGCRLAVSGAINWFFSHVEEGVILEDDCLPHLDFFYFCSAMLDRYRHKRLIMHINGQSLCKSHSSQAGYYFSQNPLVWGWATWKRAWEMYDAEMDGLEDFLKQNRLNNITSSTRVSKRIEKYMTKTKNLETDSWGNRWILSIWKQEGWAITPSINLVQNIGFGEDAAHTHQPGAERLSIKTEALHSMKEPLKTQINRRLDRLTFKLYYLNPPPFLLQIYLHLSRYSEKIGIKQFFRALMKFRQIMI